MQKINHRAGDPRRVTDEAIRTEDLSKVYTMGDEEVRAADSITVSIKEGEFVSILGPSGSGKSTLLQLMGLLDSQTSGKIYIEGKDSEEMNEDEKAEFRRKKIGFVFQQFNLLNNLNVFENVAIPLMLNGVDSEERKMKVIPFLERLGLADRLAHYPNQLSGGQMQRVAIARALVMNPKIIMADEPTGNLDSKTGEDIIKILKELNKSGKTILVITHDKGIAKHAQKIMHVKDGKIDKIEVL